MAAGVRLGITILAATLAFFTGCATCERSAGRPFVFGQDNFAFTNELVWTYEFGTGDAVTTRDVEPAPENPHRCFPMLRGAREFFYHARFVPELPKMDENENRELVDEIVDRNSRCPSGAEDRITIPGYANLHDFSSDYPEMIRKECGGSWRSYLQRGNWRMVFPVTNRGERNTARELFEGVREGRLPIIHIHRFPDVRLNHAILIYGAEERGEEIYFSAYDPNNPQRSAELRFDKGKDAFIFERNQYFAGGTVKVYEVYRGWFY
jgi:hypothetical protein